MAAAAHGSGREYGSSSASAPQCQQRIDALRGPLLRLLAVPPPPTLHRGSGLRCWLRSATSSRPCPPKTPQSHRDGSERHTSVGARVDSAEQTSWQRWPPRGGFAARGAGVRRQPQRYTREGGSVFVGEGVPVSSAASSSASVSGGMSSSVGRHSAGARPWLDSAAHTGLARRPLPRPCSHERTSSSSIGALMRRQARLQVSPLEQQ